MTPRALATYGLILLFAPMYLGCVIFVCIAKGIYEEVRTEFPREWRMIRNSWRAAKG